MRVTQCCCGCSLRTGTLILLWLDLISQAGSIVRLSIGATSMDTNFTFMDSAMLGWACLVLVIVIYGIVGVEKHRPSYLLPYIGIYVGSLVFVIFITMFIWAGSIAGRDAVIDAISRRFAMAHPDQSLDEAQLRRMYNDMMSTITVGLIIGIALSAYFLCVIYSYYKQMQEEDKGIYNPPSGTGVVYAAPTNQNRPFDCPPAYGQQPVAAPYAQPNAGYPQPNAGYPQPNAGYPQPNAGYPQPNAGYPQPNAGYPQQQYPSYPQKE